MPAARRVASLLRWDLEEIDRWIADGCRRCRRGHGVKFNKLTVGLVVLYRAMQRYHEKNPSLSAIGKPPKL